jgi:hypothetical protein
MLSSRKKVRYMPENKLQNATLYNVTNIARVEHCRD